ncbi:hypothetical protein M2145_002622 [Lachnospiraceae bacterium PF1-21]|uniref:Uncharacterized protein n=1 Tax=Ohessyouella blattaphilus TaxID=2949333 RepID=A0ABT1EK50_9FIRM|nr:hypothetical protein [Ohessyouella blattaphilus]MCP1111084.1 hypothetical protein [Ohessyouella blattaphilus]MCR8564478.1 hypothetical protein [Ohessyouella blattaphilus]
MLQKIRYELRAIIIRLDRHLQTCEPELERLFAMDGQLLIVIRLLESQIINIIQHNEDRI